MTDPFTIKADFVRAWQRAASVQEVALATGLGEKEAGNLAAGLRRNGVQLKHMPRPRPQGTKTMDAADYANLRIIALHELELIRDERTRQEELDRVNAIRAKCSSVS